MEKFILIETSTDACSAAIAQGSRVIASKYIQEYKVHARLLIPLIEEILKENSLSVHDFSAVAVSEGPGSYTGLRVGVSSAKGLCYGAGIPLIGVSTLDILAEMGKKHISTPNSLIIPMLDARRMEVYCAIYNSSGERIGDIEAKVLEQQSFESYFRDFSQIIFIGDGAQKFSTLLDNEKLSKSKFLDIRPDAQYMANLTHQKWNKKEFKDIAYFEPFYLKDFVAGVSKKSLI